MWVSILGFWFLNWLFPWLNLLRWHSHAMWPGLPHYKQNLFLKCWSFSSLESFSNFWVTAFTWVLSSSVVAEWFLNPPWCLLVLPVKAVLLYNHHIQSNSLAFSTRSSSVISWGDTPSIFWCKAWGSTFLMVHSDSQSHILVARLFLNLVVMN